jgi:hypothetical protein
LLYLFEDMACWLNDTREVISEYSVEDIDSLSGSKLGEGERE